jgi:hypothetical protein
VFGLSDTAIAGLASAGVGASFADDTLKKEMGQGIDRWLDQPGKE